MFIRRELQAELQAYLASEIPCHAQHSMLVETNPMREQLLAMRSLFVDVGPSCSPPPYVGQGEVRTLMKRMLHSGVIEHAQSEWASRDVLIPKPDGILRICVDHTRLKAVMVKDTYRLPRVDECSDPLGSAQLCTTLDRNSDYWQIPIDPRDHNKTTFMEHPCLL